MTLQRKLKALLRDRKQKAVAEQVGIHAVTLGTYVNHGVTPSSDIAFRLAQVLGVDLSWLLDDSQSWPVVPAKHPTFPPAPETAKAA